MAGRKRLRPDRLAVESLVLTGSQRSYLRSLAHDLEPVIQVGVKGLTDALFAEIEAALAAHELIKLRLNRHAPVDPSEAADAIAERTGAAIAQIIGHVLVVYRPRELEEDRKIRLPRSAT
jgi:RNA-binding protein